MCVFILKIGNSIISDIERVTMKCGIVLFTLVIGVIQAKLRVDQVWPGGFQGAIEIPISNQVIGWNIEIQFHKKARLDAWLGILRSETDGKIFLYDNQPWNEKLDANTVFSFEFTVNDGVTPSDVKSISFKGQPVNIDSLSSSTTGSTPNPTGSTPTFQSTSASSTTPLVAVIDGKYNYGAVLQASLLFYEAQRAGKLPANNRIRWRGNSMLMDKGENGEDLTGGYFDAGDYVKFGFPMASFTTLLAWGAIEYKDAYEKAGEFNAMLQAIRWSTDYFIKAHVSEREFYGQVGDGHADHASWSRPEDWTAARPAWKVTTQKPGTDLVCETAAALAATSILFRSVDAAYSSELLTHAQQLYKFGNEYRGKYSDSIPNAAEFYRSWSGFGDELAWAAAWLLRATGDASYEADVERHYREFGLDKRPNEFGWDEKTAGVQILMAKITTKQVYRQQAETFCNYIVRQAPKSLKGLVFLSQWGALRHAGNVAFVCLQAAEAGINSQEYIDFAVRQINYMLGDSGRSYVIGFGQNFPQRPHHRSSSCPSRPAVCDWNAYNSPQPNPQLLIGALVGGPDQNDSYEDRRDDYIKNEVATDYNGGFQSAVAGLLHYQMK
ncbi:unnamed protein product [Rotaria socialis]|uniref:Endoglucanase n=2 Tax=Rotaria socialis TaxID=392032 RepID=A0A817WH41_9BILA|nr:unnamed protein product [Rotaria socialis]